MKSAEVTARIRPAYKNELSKVDTKDMSPVAADVDCFFEMEYADPATKDSFRVVFPVFEKSEHPVIITKFQTWTEGVESNDLETVDIGVTDTSGRSVDYDGCGWASPPPKGKVQKVRVRYTMLLPARHGKAKFTYVVRSGGTWAKPIGHETVTVHVAKPLRFNSPGKLQPASKEANCWTWDLKNIRPTDDVEAFVEFSTDQAPEAGQ